MKVVIPIQPMKQVNFQVEIGGPNPSCSCKLSSGQVEEGEPLNWIEGRATSSFTAPQTGTRRITEVTYIDTKIIDFSAH